MRRKRANIIFLCLIATACQGQQRASVSVIADSSVARDLRPFGKYLVEICSISGATPGTGDARTVSCSRLPFPISPTNPRNAPIQPKDQTVTVALTCDPKAKTPCQLTNPKVGGDFFVAASADSGLPVQQKVLLGNASPVGGSRIVHYYANGSGPIIIRATAQGNALYSSGGPVDLILQADSDLTSSSSSCPVLPPSPGTQSSPLDAGTIVSVLGNPTPFILVAQGPNTVAIYSTRQPPLRANEDTILYSFQNAIGDLAGRTAASLGITPAAAKPFTVELTIPHGNALGDLATRLGSLSYSQLTVQDVGKNKIRVTSPSQPDCPTWKGFLSDVRDITWQLISDPMNYKLYYLSSSDVATAFSGLSTAPATSTSTSSTTAAGGSGTSSSGSATPATGTASGASATPTNASITVTQPPGSNIQINSDTTPCVVAGLASGNATPCGSSSASTSAAATPAAATPAATAPAAQAPLGMASVAVAAGTGEQSPPDLLLYSDAAPGDDAQIFERNRVLADLDLPRPEMILTAWVTQNSSANPQAMGAFNNMVKDLVTEYDRQFEMVVLNSWRSLKLQSAGSDYFNKPFRSYLEDRFIADTFKASKTGATVQELSQSYLDTSQAKLVDSVYPMQRSDLGICERGRYCLGYNTLFNPVRPALTDLLLLIIAAQQPRIAAYEAIYKVQGDDGLGLPTESVCDNQPAAVRKRCEAIWRLLDIDHVSPPPQQSSCIQKDLQGILGSLLFERESQVHLECFREEVDILMGTPETDGEPSPSGVGLLRAVVSDFLFNYKMSQQYPHEFVPYDLSHSADALNSALSPLIDAFNRDLRSYQMFMRADMQYRTEELNSRTDGRCCVKRLFGLDKPSFFNDGLVTVRTIAGQATNVSTSSQSFLNASTAPELSTLLSSLAGSGSQGAGSSQAGTTSATAASGSSAAASPGSSTVTLPKGAFGAIAAGLANYQTSFAQIGRQLSFTATARSLATASSAEIAVTLNADDSSGVPLFTGPGANDPAFNTSRVASHDTTTRVRVDSIKLFEVSSFSAIVERSRSRFPLLPPFVEIPYIGTFAGIPLGAAKEFHSSTAIISAYVVPTAADIAYGLRFVSDLIVDGVSPGPCSFFKGASGPDVTNACLFRKMFSLRDVGTQTIREFNKNMTLCFANNPSAEGCFNVSFDNTIEISQ